MKIACRISKTSYHSEAVKKQKGYIVDCVEIDEETEEYKYLVDVAGIRTWVHSDDIIIL